MVCKFEVACKFNEGNAPYSPYGDGPLGIHILENQEQKHEGNFKFMTAGRDIVSHSNKYIMHNVWYGDIFIAPHL